MRIDVQPRGRIGNAHRVQQVDGPLAAGLLITTLMDLNRFHNLVADGKARVEAGHWITEDHRHFRPHQLAPLFSEMRCRSRPLNSSLSAITRPG